MNLQEILKAQNLTDEQIKAISEEMKKNNIFTASEENLDIRYGKLKTEHDTLKAEHGEAKTLIEQMKSGTKDNEALQGKITAYETQVSELNKALEEAKTDAAMDRALMQAGAKSTDIDYLKFQWRKKGEISLDEKGEIKGADDAVAALKTQCSGQFETVSNGRQIDEHRLPKPEEDGQGMTKAEFLRKPYAERAAFANENPEAYKTLMNH